MPPASAGDPPTLAGRSGSVSYGVTSPWILVHTLLCVCPPRVESLFPLDLLKSCNQIPLAFKVWFSGNDSSCCQTPGWEAWRGAQDLHSRGWKSVVQLFSSLWVTHPVVMGFDFIVIVPLLPSHCGFSFVFGCGVSFLVSSSVFLSMIAQQSVVIPVLSQEGVSACPSTPPSWTNLSLLEILNLDNLFIIFRPAPCLLSEWPTSLCLSHSWIQIQSPILLAWQHQHFNIYLYDQRLKLEELQVPYETNIPLKELLERSDPIITEVKFPGFSQ